MSSTVLLTTWIGRPGASTPGTSPLMVAGKHFLFEDDQRKSTKYDMQKTVNFLDYIPMKTWTVNVKILLYKALCHIQYNLMKKCGNPCAQLILESFSFLSTTLIDEYFIYPLYGNIILCKICHCSATCTESILVSPCWTGTATPSAFSSSTQLPRYISHLIGTCIWLGLKLTFLECPCVLISEDFSYRPVFNHILKW